MTANRSISVRAVIQRQSHGKWKVSVIPVDIEPFDLRAVVQRQSRGSLVGDRGDESSSEAGKALPGIAPPISIVGVGEVVQTLVACDPNRLGDLRSESEPASLVQMDRLVIRESPASQGRSRWVGYM